ncbi:hypothetical protein GPNCGGLF_LOCUS1984 [Methylorubrum aminovorans]
MQGSRITNSGISWAKFVSVPMTISERGQYAVALRLGRSEVRSAIASYMSTKRMARCGAAH